MNKEYEEMQEVAAQVIKYTRRDSCPDCGADFTQKQPSSSIIIAQILALETDTCRIAVVKKNAVLPTSMLKIKLAKEHDWYGQGLFDMAMDLQTDGWVKEVFDISH